MDTPAGTTSSAPKQLTRLGLRRAGIVEGSTLTIWRLRKTNKQGTQKTRDITKVIRFKTPEEANIALQLKVTEWEARQKGSDKADQADPEEGDPAAYLKAENAEDLSDAQLEALTSPE